MMEHIGRPHMGKTGAAYHSTASLTKTLNTTARSSILAKMAQYDPNGVFMNDFGARLKGTGTAANIDPEVTHCALLENYFCSKNSKCGPLHTCSQVKGYRYPACVDPLYPPIFPISLDPNPDWAKLPWAQPQPTPTTTQPQ
jgi:hypothetical protein